MRWVFGSEARLERRQARYNRRVARLNAKLATMGKSPVDELPEDEAYFATMDTTNTMGTINSNYDYSTIGTHKPHATTIGSRKPPATNREPQERIITPEILQKICGPDGDKWERKPVLRERCTNECLRTAKRASKRD